jgi:hypothetical protein
MGVSQLGFAGSGPNQGIFVFQFCLARCTPMRIGEPHAFALAAFGPGQVTNRCEA